MFRPYLEESLAYVIKACIFSVTAVHQQKVGLKQHIIDVKYQGLFNIGTLIIHMSIPDIVVSSAASSLEVAISDTFPKLALINWS